MSVAILADAGHAIIRRLPVAVWVSGVRTAVVIAALLRTLADTFCGIGVNRYFCLSTAANLALDDQSEWVALVKQLDLDQDQELRVIIRLAEDSPKQETPEERDLKRIGERVEKLKAFVALAQEFVVRLEKQRGTKAG